MYLETVGIDILTDRFGDIILSHGDISVSRNIKAIARTNAKHRIRSNRGDMNMYHQYGAGIEEFIGKKISTKMCEDIKSRILNCLQEDNFFSDLSVNVQYVIDNHTVLFKVVVGESISTVKDNSSEVNVIFDIMSGEIDVF